MAPRSNLKVVTKSAPAAKAKPTAKAAEKPAALVFEVDWSKLTTRDLLLFQQLSLVDQMSEAEKNAMTLKVAPMLDRMIVGGMPELPIERYGDLITAFFAKMQERSNTKN